MVGTCAVFERLLTAADFKLHRPALIQREGRARYGTDIQCRFRLYRIHEFRPITGIGFLPRRLLAGQGKQQLYW